MIFVIFTKLVLQVVCSFSAKWAVRRANWLSRNRRLQMVIDKAIYAVIHYAIFHTDTVVTMLQEVLRWLF